MRRFRFGIRTVLLLAAIVAFSMLILLERQRYFREHVFVTVLDSVTGVQISGFQYRTWVITKDSPPRVEWSPWGNHRGSSPFSIQVPAYCRFHIEVLAIGVPNSRNAESGTLLVLPESAHNITLRIANSYRASGVIVDSSTNEPIEGVVVAPLSRVNAQPDEQESRTDAKGRFDVYMDVPNDDLFAFHPKYQYRFWPSSSSKSIGLKRGMTIHGRVVDMDSGEPVPECEVDVMYRSGIPLAESELPMGVSADDDGTSAALRSKSPPRTAVTDSDGRFELVMEPLALNTALQVHKEGWNGSIVFAMKIENKPIELRRGKFELAGQLVSEEGTPISEFSVSTTRAGDEMSGESTSEHWIQHSDGHFCIFSTKPFLNYTIRASGYSPIHGGIGRSTIPLDSPVNEPFRLSRGSSLSGIIEKTKLHTRDTAVFLVDLRYCDSFDDVHSPRLGPHYSDDEGYIYSDTEPNRIQYESRIGSDGRYTFANLAPGRYALLVLYGDQTVNAIPIEVGFDDIVVPKIALPALGNLKGIVKERTIDSSQPPNVETTVNAFAVYTLHRPGDPFGLPFRTNHRGEFSIENVPIGKVTIGPSNFGRTEDNEVICVPQVIREGVTSLATSDLGVLCVLLINESPRWFGRFGPLKANLHGPVESEVSVEMAGERSRDGFQRLVIFGRSDLPSGTYSVDIKDGPVEFNVDFEFHRNQTPSNILLSHHWLSCKATRDRSGSMGGVKATLMRNKRSVSSSYLPFESSDKVECLVQSSGPFDVLVHDFSNGYSLLKNVSFSGQTIDLGDIVWKPGAKLVVSVNLSGLDVFPEKVTISHEEIGISFTENWYLSSSVEFGNIPPGKWFIEVTNTDPLLGKRTLISREIVVVQPEDVRLELRQR